MTRRRLAATGAAALLILLTACSAGAEPVGTAQETEIAEDGTDATISMTVSAVDQESIDLLSDFDLDADEQAMTPYLVRYSIELVEGSIGADFTPNPMMSFGDTPFLSAEDAEGNDAVSMQLIGGIDACPGLEDGALAGLAVGESAEGCRVFLAESDAGLRSVSFGDLTWETATD